LRRHAGSTALAASVPNVQQQRGVVWMRIFHRVLFTQPRKSVCKGISRFAMPAMFHILGLSYFLGMMTHPHPNPK
jgi:hypothetical protein